MVTVSKMESINALYFTNYYVLCTVTVCENRLCNLHEQIIGRNVQPLLPVGANLRTVGEHPLCMVHMVMSVL